MHSVPLKAICPLYGPLSPLQPSVPSMALCPSTAICSLYGLLFSLGPSILSLYIWSSVHSTDLCILTAFCLFCSPLSFLRTSVSSTAIYTPLNPYVPATGHVPLNDTLYPLWSYVPFKAICPLYGPMSSLWPSATSMASATSRALCPLNCPVSPLQLLPPPRPPVPSEALCPFYGPWQKKRNDLPCFAKCFAKRVLSKLQGLSRSISC
jgi:hypothetical protein